MSALEELRQAAKGLGAHPQDHGWRDLYRLFDYGLKTSAEPLTKILVECYRARPTSATHLITLLGIALQSQVPAPFSQIARQGSLRHRMEVLENALSQNMISITKILLTRQNSFTCARRFIVPQVILSAYFSQSSEAVNFADLGTGLGILPRQINSRQIYDHFSAGLLWPGGIPDFQDLHIASIYGVDRGPMPDIDWVRACYGRSPYYSSLYDELLATLARPEIENARVVFRELDLTDADALRHFIRANNINAANMTYVLYEFDSTVRANIIETVVSALRPPGLLIVTEPSSELHRQGCVVEVFHGGSIEPLTLCFVSDGHFKGYVLPLDDYDIFHGRYPIAYRR